MIKDPHVPHAMQGVVRGAEDRRQRPSLSGVYLLRKPDLHTEELQSHSYGSSLHMTDQNLSFKQFPLRLDGCRSGLCEGAGCLKQGYGPEDTG